MSEAKSLISRSFFLLVHVDSFLRRYPVDALRYLHDSVKSDYLTHITFLHTNIQRSALLKIKQIMAGTPSSIYQYASARLTEEEVEKELLKTAVDYSKSHQNIVLMTDASFSSPNPRISIQKPILLHNGNGNQPCFVFPNEQLTNCSEMTKNKEKMSRTTSSTSSNCSEDDDFVTLSNLFGQKFISKLWPKIQHLDSINDRLLVVAEYSRRITRSPRAS